MTHISARNPNQARTDIEVPVKNKAHEPKIVANQQKVAPAHPAPSQEGEVDLDA